MIQIKGALCLLLAFGAPVDAAQADLPLGAAALTHKHAGKTVGCGIRVSGGRPGPRSIWMDVSFNVYETGIALVHATAYRIALADYDAEGRPERISMQRAWLKPSGSDRSTRLGENTEARDALLYAVALDDAGGLFEAVANRRPITVALRAWGEPREWVLEGVAELPETARAEIATCLSALVN